MTKRLVTASGTPIQLGRELGKGGEGSVFDVPTFPNQVAKLYHRPLDNQKQAKLRFMASHGNQTLAQYAAWPQSILQDANTGAIAGFLMPKVTGRDPVHMLYSPAHRKQERPGVAWDFLLFSARNTAAAFEVLHTNGHILGDINQGNVMVGADSKVVLIDCDSYQINANGTIHYCEVGVSHFTPPELQGLSSFHGVSRTVNHDNFGLALLIFHLLFGGRHPFSGKPLRNDVGDTLESNIKAFCYTYARDAQIRGIAPPPGAISMSLVPDAMQSMFEVAFTERGASQGRPSAKQWVTALDALRTRLKKCPSAAIHVYPDHLTRCPWCEMEKQGIIYFVDLGATVVDTASHFSIVQVWAAIQAVSAPAAPNIPSISSIAVTPSPLPNGIPAESHNRIFQVIVLVLFLGLFFAVPHLFLLWIIVGFFGCAAVGNIGAKERQAEQQKRRNIKDGAKKAYDEMVKRADVEIGPAIFNLRLKHYAGLRDEYQALPLQEKAEIDMLHKTAEQRQRYKYLDRHFIDAASISGIGPGKKAALRSFGIETAADVEWNKVRAVRGFGEVLTRAVVDWRKAIERRFVFNPAQAITHTDLNAVKARVLARKKSIENELANAPNELRRLKVEAERRAPSLRPIILSTAHAYAQAKADADLLG